MNEFFDKLSHFIQSSNERWFHTSSAQPHKYGLPLVLMLVISIVTALLFPRGRSYQFSDLRIGDVYIGEEVIAPFDFPINKSAEQLELDIDAAKERVAPVFIRNDSLHTLQIAQLTGFFKTLKIIRDSSAVDVQKREILANFLGAYDINPAEETLSSLLQTASHRQKSPSNAFDNRLEQGLSDLLNELFAIGVLDRKKGEILQGKGKISIVNEDNELLENIDFYYDMDGARHLLKEGTEKLTQNRYRTSIAKAGYQILTAFLVPNLQFDNAEYEKRMDQAVRSVPLARGMVLDAERIIDTHERVTEENLQKLRSLAEVKAERAEYNSNANRLLANLGKFLIAAFAMIITGLYIYLARRVWLHTPKLVLLIFLVYLFVISISSFLNRFGLSGYLLPVTIGAMLITIFYDATFGSVATVSLSIIAAALRGNDFNVIIVSLIAGLISVLSVTKVRSRNWLLRSILMISGAYVLSISALEWVRFTPITQILSSIGFGVINGVFSPILVYGLTVIIESAFDLTTDMKLLELSDLNKPVLKELALKSPGTYFHSVVVGNLAEAAAEAINANSLLARVGAYYHDIGKIINSKYFIENQSRGMSNPHDKLTPSMSFLILVNHVRKGEDIARQYKLPAVILDFIRSHHGTNLMGPFYKKAIELNQNKTDQVSDSNFRYPGPRPRTKETGIVMLADSIEAASRTLKDPSVGRIEAMVLSIIHDRFIHAELDECPLTLRELHKIGESFKIVLIGIYHARIEYPDQDEKFFGKKQTKQGNGNGNA